MRRDLLAVLLLIGGYVSLGSMAAGVMFPILLLTVFQTPSLLLKIFSVLVAIANPGDPCQKHQQTEKGEEKKFIRKNKRLIIG